MSIVVCGLVCVSVSFFCERILILKWKGICFSPNLTFIQGRHNWWKKKKKKRCLYPAQQVMQGKRSPVWNGRCREDQRNPWSLAFERGWAQIASRLCSWESALTLPVTLSGSLQAGGFPLGDSSPSSQSETRMPACFHTVGRIESMSAE